MLLRLKSSATTKEMPLTLVAPRRRRWCSRRAWSERAGRNESENVSARERGNKKEVEVEFFFSVALAASSRASNVMPPSRLDKAPCWPPFPSHGQENVRMRQFGKRERASKGAKGAKSTRSSFTCWPEEAGAMMLDEKRRSTSMTTTTTTRTGSLTAWKPSSRHLDAPAPKNACRERATGKNGT